MLDSKFTNVTKNFIVSGVKKIGDYTYVLLIDIGGQTLIKRIKSDNSEIKYALRPEEESIDEFWSDPAGQSYEYINKL